MPSGLTGNASPGRVLGKGRKRLLGVMDVLESRGEENFAFNRPVRRQTGVYSASMSWLEVGARSAGG